MITLYHGSNMEVSKPRLMQSKRLLDFGNGFYLTSDYEQAKKLAVRTTDSRSAGKAAVSVFDVDNDEMQKLNILIFNAPDKEWLRFISSNRKGKPEEIIYDIVIGPVANDQTVRTINNYLKGYFSDDIAIQLLLPQNLKDQYAFKTEKALEILHYKQVVFI